MRHTFLVVTVKRWLKSVYIYGSYRKIKTGIPFFGPFCIISGLHWGHNQSLVFQRLVSARVFSLQLYMPTTYRKLLLLIFQMIFNAGQQESAMCGRPALLVVLLLSVGRLAHQQSTISDEYVPAKTDGKVKSLPVAVAKLHGSVKRHIGKFVRIGRMSTDDSSTLRSNDALWWLYYTPIAPRLSRRVIASRRRRSDAYDDTVDTTASLYDIYSQKARRSGLRRDTVADSLPAELKKNSKSGGVRFVRIGKADGQPRTSVNRERGASKNMFRRSLENRFVRIGK